MLAVAFVFAVHEISRENTKARKPGFLVRVFVRSWQKPLTVLGRSSLFIYWIHVELVYGYTTGSFGAACRSGHGHRRTSYFASLMYGAIVLEIDWLATRRSPPASARPHNRPA